MPIIRFKSIKIINKRSEEHTSELQSQSNLVCRLLLEKKKVHQRSTRDDDPPRLARCHPKLALTVYHLGCFGFNKVDLPPRARRIRSVQHTAEIPSQF